MEEQGYSHPMLKLAFEHLTKLIPEGIFHFNQMVAAYQEETVQLFLKHIFLHYYI